MKGMAYTPFAVFAASMLFLLFISPLDVYPSSVHQDLQASETSQTFHNSFTNSFGTGFEESVNQYLIEFNDDVNSSGPINEAEDEFNSNYSLSSSNYYGIDELENNIEQAFSDDRRTIDFEIGDNWGFESEGLKITSEIGLEYNLTDPITDIASRYDENFVTEAAINGSVDPLAEFTAGETVHYRYCGYERPAYKAGEGSGSGSDVFGYAVVNPEDPDSIEDKGEKIIFLESADQTDDSILDDFKAVVVEDNSYSNGDYIQEFNFDRQISTDQNVILTDDEAYISHFREIIDNQCFIESSEAPNLFQRMENENNNLEGDGMLTFIEDTSSHAEANEDYIYFDDSRGALNPANVTGVSTSTLDERPWFSVQQDNMNYWNLGSLIK